MVVGGHVHGDAALGAEIAKSRGPDLQELRGQAHPALREVLRQVDGT